MTRALLHNPVFIEPGISAALKPEAGVIPFSGFRFPVSALRFLFSVFLISVFCLLAPAAEAACSNPTGNAGDLIYNYSYHVYQYCNGTNWHATGNQASSASSTTISLLQHTSNTGSFVTFGSTTTAGSLIVACGYTGSGTADTSMATTDSAGNSFSVAVGPTFLSGAGTIECYYAINKSAYSGDEVTMTGSPEVLGGLEISEFSGISSSSPIDTTNAATGNSTTPSSGSTNATSNANDLIIGMCEVANTATAGSGFTSLDTVNGNNDEYETETSTGSYAATWTQSTGVWVADMVAFKAGGSYGTCTSPTGNEADMFYNSTYHLYEFCSGTSWVAMGPTGTGGSCTGPSGNEADIIYNSSHNVMQYCNGSWVGMGY